MIKINDILKDLFPLCGELFFIQNIFIGEPLCENCTRI